MKMEKLVEGPCRCQISVKVASMVKRLLSLVKPTEIKKKQKAKQLLIPIDKNIRSKIQSENRGRYSAASSSQKSITKAYREKHQDQFVQDQKVKEDHKQKESKNDAFKKHAIATEKDKALVKNPVLKSKLDLSAKEQPTLTTQNNTNKAKPPRPSLKSLLSRKGVVNKKMNYKELLDLNPSLKQVSSKDLDNLQRTW